MERDGIGRNDMRAYYHILVEREDDGFIAERRRMGPNQWAFFVRDVGEDVVGKGLSPYEAIIDLFRQLIKGA